MFWTWSNYGIQNGQCLTLLSVYHTKLLVDMGQQLDYGVPDPILWEIATHAGANQSKEMMRGGPLLLSNPKPPHHLWVHVSPLFTVLLQGCKEVRWAVPHLKSSFPERLSQVIQINNAHIHSVVSSYTSRWLVYFNRPPGCIIPHSYLSCNQEICPVCLSGRCYHFCPVTVTASCPIALILWKEPAYLSQGEPLR